METYTVFGCPGTLTLRTRIEYAGDVAGQAVRPWRLRQRVENDNMAIGFQLDPESTWTALVGGSGIGTTMKQLGGAIKGLVSVLRVTAVLRKV
jgi:predicted ribonuclease YlaK